MSPVTTAAASVPVPPLPPAAPAPSGEGEAAFAAQLAQAEANQRAEAERAGDEAESASGAGQAPAGEPPVAGPQPVHQVIAGVAGSDGAAGGLPSGGTAGPADAAALRARDNAAVMAGTCGRPVAEGAVPGGPDGGAAVLKVTDAPGDASAPDPGRHAQKSAWDLQAGGEARMGVQVRPAPESAPAAEDPGRATAVSRAGWSTGGEAAGVITRGTDADGADAPAGVRGSPDSRRVAVSTGAETPDAAAPAEPTAAAARPPGAEPPARATLEAEKLRKPPAEENRVPADISARSEVADEPAPQPHAAPAHRAQPQGVRDEASTPRQGDGPAVRASASTLRNGQDADAPPAAAPTPAGWQQGQAPQDAPSGLAPLAGPRAGGVRPRVFSRQPTEAASAAGATGQPLARSLAGPPRPSALSAAGLAAADRDGAASSYGGWTPESGGIGAERLAPVWAEATAQPVAEARGGSGGHAASVARQVTQAVVEYRGAEAQVVLDPEELGPLRVAVSLEEGGTVIRIHAERPETAELMRRHADLLLQDLAESGVSQPRLSFASGGESGAGRESGGRPAPPPEPVGPPAAPAPPGSAPHRPAARGLDIRV